MAIQQELADCGVAGRYFCKKIIKWSIANGDVRAMIEVYTIAYFAYVIQKAVAEEIFFYACGSVVNNKHYQPQG